MLLKAKKYCHKNTANGIYNNKIAFLRRYLPFSLTIFMLFLKQ